MKMARFVMELHLLRAEAARHLACHLPLLLQLPFRCSHLLGLPLPRDSEILFQPRLQDPSPTSAGFEVWPTEHREASASESEVELLLSGVEERQTTVGAVSRPGQGDSEVLHKLMALLVANR